MFFVPIKMCVAVQYQFMVFNKNTMQFQWVVHNQYRTFVPDQLQRRFAEGEAKLLRSPGQCFPLTEIIVAPDAEHRH